jgi:hypothetical protein
MSQKDDPILARGYLLRPESARPDPNRVGFGEGFVMGAADPIVGGAQLLERVLPQPVSQAIQGADRWLYEQTGGAIGSEITMDEWARQREAEYQGRRDAAGQTGVDWSRMAGGAATALPVAKVPLAATTLGRLGQGALIGGAYGGAQPVTAGSPDDFGQQKAMQAGVGAATGAASEAVLGPMISSAVRRGQSPDVSLLMGEGVRPTFGQIMGGRVAGAESAMTSVPALGGTIASGRRSALEQFNQAAINRAVAPVGQRVDGFGDEAVNEATKILNKAYADARNMIADGIPVDATFNRQLVEARQLGEGLTDEMQKKLNKIINQQVLRSVRDGRIPPDSYKKIDSELTEQFNKFRKGIAVEQEYADVVYGVRNALRDQMARTNPDAAVAFRAADEGYRNLIVVENAANAAKGRNGLFTASQLQNAALRSDTQVRGRGLRSGAAPYADLAGAGQRVLGGGYPDSGTAGRSMLGLAALASPAGLYAYPMETALTAGALGLATGGYAAGNPLARFAVTNPTLARMLGGVPTTGAAVSGAQAPSLLDERR